MTPILFFDFDDTLSEQIPFNVQYANHLGAALAAAYGDEERRWTAQAVAMLITLEADYTTRFRGNPLNGYRAWLPTMLNRATELMFTGMEVPLPADTLSVALRMRAEALSHCDALFTGAKEMLHTVHHLGMPIHLASGNDSAHLLAALRGVGLDSLVDGFYGPDLIDCAKEGPEFFAGVLSATGTAPMDALFIDNDPVAIGWARASGAQAIQVQLLTHHPVEPAAGVRAVVTDLSALSDILAQG